MALQDDLKNFIGKIGGFWRSLPTTRKLLIAALILAFLLSLVFLTVTVTKPTYNVLVKNLSEEEAGRIAQALDNMGVQYKAGPGGAILVPDTVNVYELRMKLAAEGVIGTATKGFELLDKQSFGATAFDKQVNYQRALQGELERSIATIKGVKFARVFLNIPKFTYYTREYAKPSASVLVYLEPGAELSPKQVRGIMELVAGAVEGLDIENVKVVDNYSRLLSERVIMEREGIEATTKFELQKQIQDYYTRLITQKLERIFGVGNVVVMSDIKLNWQTIEKESKKYEPVLKKEGIVISKEEERESYTGVGDVGGEVGTEGNIPPITYPSVTGGTAKSERTHTIVNYNVNEIYEKIVTNRYGEISSKTFTVVIDSSALSHLPSTSALEEDMKHAIALATNSPPTSVSIMFLPFNREVEMSLMREMTMAKELEKRRKFIIGLALLSTLIIAIFFLIIYQVRKVRAQKMVLERKKMLEEELRKEIAMEEEELAISAEEAELQALIRDVTDIAGKDPESVADVIRSWLTS